jgi:hypothetical protein
LQARFSPQDIRSQGIVNGVRRFSIEKRAQADSNELRGLVQLTSSMFVPAILLTAESCPTLFGTVEIDARAIFAFALTPSSPVTRREAHEVGTSWTMNVVPCRTNFREPSAPTTR